MDHKAVGVMMTFNLDHLEVGKSLLVLPIPTEIVALIGRVAVQWGGFEARMDQIIATTLAGCGREDVNWRFKSFRARKELFRELMVEYTSTYCPQETSTLLNVAANAAELHWRRNTVLHGTIGITSEPDSSSETGYRAAFTAHSRHQNRSTHIPLDQVTLDKLWHDIAHLGGALMSSYLRMGGGIDGVELVVEDKEFLQGPDMGEFNFVPILGEKGLSPL